MGRNEAGQTPNEGASKPAFRVSEIGYSVAVAGTVQSISGVATGIACLYVIEGVDLLLQEPNHLTESW